MEIQQIHEIFLKCNSVSIDTRKILPYSLFIAIKGEKYDANAFVNEALEKGASYVIIDNNDYYIDYRTIYVNDSLSTLQKLAKYHREYLKIPIVALTGSNGKTTTKELVNVVISKKYKTKATFGNLNNHIGVPLTLLSFTTDTEIGIVEMGANHQKEIEFLCNIAQPDYGYITNFGKAHLEGFGGIEGVIKGKSEMYTYLKENSKSVFVNIDDPIQVEKSKNMNIISFGLNKPNAFMNILKVSANPFVEIDFSETHLKSNLIGLYNANNINFAITTGKYFKIDDKQIREAIEGYSPDNNRSQIIYKNTNEIILDAYNANPSSMIVAIDNFVQLNKDNKMLFLGDMFELGNESLFEHKEIVEKLANQDTIDCYFIGKDFYSNKIERLNFHFFENFESFTKETSNLKFINKTILIKGSRGMALERVLEFI